MTKKSGLGRGLDSIFSDNELAPKGDGVKKLRIFDVEPKGDQPRTVFDEEALKSLSDSIRENGLIQPIAVREIPGGRYQIIAGERRWRACKMAGMEEISAIVMEADDLKVARLALIENIQRENLNPLEEAKAYRVLMENYDLTQEEVADSVGRARSTVANSLRLLELPEVAANCLVEGTLSMGHCRALLGLKDKEKTAALVKTIIEKGLSVRQTESLVKSENRVKKGKPVTQVKIDYTAELEKKVRSLSGRNCKISAKGQKKTVTFEYTNDDDLEEILSLVCKKNITED